MMPASVPTRVFAFWMILISLYGLAACSSLPLVPTSTPTRLPTRTATQASTPTHTATRTRLPTATAATTLIPTLTLTLTQEALTTNTSGVYGPVFVDPPTEGWICGEYTSIPQKGWMGYPDDYEPAAYVRTYAMQESIYFDLVVVEWGMFVKPGELSKVDGKTVYSYDGQNPLDPYSAIFLKDAPGEIQEKLKSGSVMAGTEIVDLQNHPLPYLISDQSMKDITYVVDDLAPHPLIDMALPCSGLADGHPISYAALQEAP
jgi:hypothetical protein